MIIHGGLKAILLYVVNAAVEQYVILLPGIEFSPVSTIASALVSTGTWMFLVLVSTVHRRYHLLLYTDSKRGR